MLEKEQNEAEAREAMGGYLSNRMSIKSKTNGTIDEDDNDEDTDSIVLDSSELSSVNGEQMVEDAAEIYANKYYGEQKERKVDYDKYHFSVAQKYDLTNRRLTWKKYKYIADELFLDLRFRLWK